MVVDEMLLIEQVCQAAEVARLGSGFEVLHKCFDWDDGFAHGGYCVEKVNKETVLFVC